MYCSRVRIFGTSSKCRQFIFFVSYNKRQMHGKMLWSCIINCFADDQCYISDTESFNNWWKLLETDEASTSRGQLCVKMILNWKNRQWLGVSNYKTSLLYSKSLLVKYVKYKMMISSFCTSDIFNKTILLKHKDQFTCQQKHHPACENGIMYNYVIIKWYHPMTLVAALRRTTLMRF